MSIDAFYNNDNLSPVVMAQAVTPSDSTDLQYTTRGLYVGGAGNVTVDMYGPLNPNGPDRSLNPVTVTFTGVTAGSILPIACRRVRSTGTTATGIVALW